MKNGSIYSHLSIMKKFMKIIRKMTHGNFKLTYRAKWQHSNQDDWLVHQASTTLVPGKELGLMKYAYANHPKKLQLAKKLKWRFDGKLTIYAYWMDKKADFFLHSFCEAETSQYSARFWFRCICIYILQFISDLIYFAFWRLLNKSWYYN